ncbi:hypothetical protein H632_c366p1 [Helicosporidium sp. ATCC 50920]|nr:hypothetical protein H632_c366p1 [Helicosporidium sp. ATCC 50920]|eukprot:KDD76078.1 hypothetical protein H632_c366p1 [Helicosporidium sp. ATCC 50920]
MSPFAPVFRSLMLKDLGNYSEGCPPDTDALCSSQESRLAVFWQLGIFALNCGPVLMGFVLDYLGPKITVMFGIFLNILGLVLFAVGDSSGPNTFGAASVILGLGNITFHIAQFHASALFPRQRGLVASGLVSGFTGSGIVMYLLLLIFEAAGSTRGAYMGVMLGYAGICALWFPLMAWIMPNSPFRVGQVFLFCKRSWRFEVRNRAELERLYRRPTSLQDFVASVSPGAGEQLQLGSPDAVLQSPGGGLVGQGAPDSSAVFWLDDAEGHGVNDWGQNGHGEALNGQATPARAPKPSEAGSEVALTSMAARATQGSAQSLQEGLRPHRASSEALHPGGAGTPEPRALPEVDAEATPAPLPPDVVWGPLVFEARRFVDLRKETFWRQLLSPGFAGMCIYYTLNVFALQFYLGSMRLQLANKGPSSNAYSNFGNVIVAFAFVTIPIIGWMLDKKGYGYTLAAINTMGILTLVLQAVPNLPIQALTIVIWMVCRFFIYASYFAIFGSMFGPRHFGKLVGVDNLANGVFCLLQYPFTYWGLHQLNGNFMVLNLAQAGALFPLYLFCWAMYKWEREDLVPMRPMEGEELPCDMMGERQRKKFADMHLPSLHMPSLPSMTLPDINLRSLIPGRRQHGYERDEALSGE